MKKMISVVSAAAVTLAAVPDFISTGAADGGDKIKIMCIGDSITDGYTSEYTGSYRKFIYHGLTGLGYDIDMVGSKGGGWTPTYTDEDTGESFEYDNDNTGYSGYAIKEYPGRSGILETLQQTNCLVETQPDIVTLQIGTNDIIDNYMPEEAAERLEALMIYILDNIPEDSVLFVTGVPDLDPNRSGVYDWFGNYRHSADWQEQYDDATAEENVHKAVAFYDAEVEATVERVRQTRGNVYPAYVQTAITDVKTQLFDGVHPNNTGYKAMGEYWTELLYSYIKNGGDVEPAVTTTATAQTTTTQTETTTTASTSVTTTDDSWWQGPTTSPDPDAGDKLRVNDLVLLSRYLLNNRTFDFSTDRMKLYDLYEDGRLDTFDLVLMRKALLENGAKAREKWGDDFCLFPDGIDITIILPDKEPERVTSGSSGSHSHSGAWGTFTDSDDPDFENVGVFS